MCNRWKCYRGNNLEDLVELQPDREKWQETGKIPSSLNDITIDLSKMLQVIASNANNIKQCRIWCHAALNLMGDIGSYKQSLWE